MNWPPDDTPRATTPFSERNWRWTYYGWTTGQDNDDALARYYEQFAADEVRFELEHGPAHDEYDPSVSALRHDPYWRDDE